MLQLKNKLCLRLFTSVLCFSWASSSCFALPSAPIAEVGSVDVEYPNSRTMIIKSSDGAILHYEDFEIGPEEEVHFSQGRAVHRINGNTPSHILGSIKSNGEVVLINTQGIVFGSESRVDAGSLIVSTLEISGEDFSKKNYQFFEKTGASILNEGFLSSQKGSLVFLAPRIQNLGAIESKFVMLGSGEHVLLDGSNVFLSGSLKDASIEQLGEIKANQVFIKLPLSTKSVLEKDETHELVTEEWGTIAIGSSSQIQSEQISIEGSQISIQGLLDATNSLDVGGKVHLFGKDIYLEGAKIDASGLLGGGEVLIGGDFQGKGSTSYASKVFMGTSSEICANAIQNGNGGLVVLWSQDLTTFLGSISARGGVHEGDGGFVETSSKKTLSSQGIVDALAPKGKIGQWLLDPEYLLIRNAPYNDPNPDPKYNGKVVWPNPVPECEKHCTCNTGEGSISLKNCDSHPVVVCSDYGPNDKGICGSAITFQAGGAIFVTGPVVGATGGIKFKGCGGRQFLSIFKKAVLSLHTLKGVLKPGKALLPLILLQFLSSIHPIFKWI